MLLAFNYVTAFCLFCFLMPTSVVFAAVAYTGISTVDITIGLKD
jgi:hypothetical protein